MSIPDLKNVKKLAALCRKAGITSFKCYNDGSYEFSIDSIQVELPKKTNKKQDVVQPKQPLSFTPDEGESILTEEQLLFWSTGNSAKDSEMPS